MRPMMKTMVHQLVFQSLLRRQKQLIFRKEMDLVGGVGVELHDVGLIYEVGGVESANEKTHNFWAIVLFPNFLHKKIISL